MKIGMSREATGNNKNAKVFSLALAGMLVALWSSVEAQQVKKIPRIGYLATGSATAGKNNAEAFRNGLRELGYIEGKNILIEYRYAEEKQDRVPSLVAELLQLKVDLIFAPSLPGIRAAKQATNTIPIVMMTIQDPVALGLVDSLARPGGNITGLTTLSRELSGKRLELLMEVVPHASRVGVLWDANAPGPILALKEYEAAATALKIQLQSLEVRGPNPDLDGVFQAAAKKRTSALITIANPVLSRHQKRIAGLAIKNRASSMCESTAYVETGCLMSYSANSADQYKRAAVYVDKILRGAKPADLPVEQPTKFEFVINLKTAKQIGLTVPPNVLARADRVIR
jgi:putative ABC transport system substrate-binding protein